MALDADKILADILAPKKPKPELILGAIDDALRSKPKIHEIVNFDDDALAWIGRSSAALRAWDGNVVGVRVAAAELDLNSGHPTSVARGYRTVVSLLAEARYSIQLELAAPTSQALPAGNVFEYFDELRKIIERAAADLLFVDPYLDADFVSRYLPHAGGGVAIRLLTSGKRISTLVPAVEAYVKQSGAAVAVRLADNLHDRYLFVDGKECHQSGASFKDGAVKAPTVLAQITDAFPAMLQTYEALWNNAKVVRQ